MIIPQDRSLFRPLLDGIRENLSQCDKAVLLGVHGEFVEDGRLQSLLDLFGINYTGSGMEASVLAMDKYYSSLLVEKAVGLKIPETIIFSSRNLSQLHEFLLGQPLISSVGCR